MHIQPLHSDVLVEDMYFGEVKTNSGIILTDDDMKDRGIHPRWAKVYAIGHENHSGLKKGDWILISHGRWSRKFTIEGSETEIRKVDEKDILLKSSVNPHAEKWVFKGKEV
ncbi:10 kDa chaperonin [uncultured archaeon]|nr:10 kDa chaperonin [uncultured archaeon]